MTISFPIEQAAETLLFGGVIAYPTEGIYGIGCIPDYDFAVARIFDIKGRTANAGLILIAPAPEYFDTWLEPSKKERKRLAKKSDYPITWIVTAKPHTPHYLTGGRGTLAVRVSNHPIVTALCTTTCSAIVSTSANRSGRPPARSALQARRFLGNSVDAVVAGPLGNATGPSEIRVALDDRVIRPAISK
jgi:L-threonylcarbamoyladenylate synthase